MTTKPNKMNKLIKTGLILLLPATLVLASGCGIKKMIKNAGTISYEVKPNPLELHGDSIAITVTGDFPPKYFHKKATLEVTPVLKYDGGEKTLKSITLRGDKVEGAGEGISYDQGGKFTVSDRILYSSGMEKADLILRAQAQYKSKTTDLPEMSIAKGTIVTPLLLQKDYMPMLDADKFDKNPTVTQKANIYYLVDSWQVRSVELKSDEMDNMYRFVEKAAADSSNFKEMKIFGYASPEGELARNSKLSVNRADEASKVMYKTFSKAKLKELASREGFYTAVTTDYEDWDGLKQMLQTSSIDGKSDALSIINSVNDPEAREAQFKQLASYDPIYEAYFPKLRRAEINLIVELKTRTDEQIKALAISNPDTLGNEELLYASTLMTSDDDKMKVYQSYARLFPEDYRGFNNTGAMYLKMGKLNEAQSEFEKASKIGNNVASVQNNLGAAAAIRGDKMSAQKFFDAAGASKEVTYNKANLDVANGKYGSAVSNYGDACTFNAALAKVLNGNASGAIQTLDCGTAKDTAEGFYLRAIIAARAGDQASATANLAKAIAMKPELKAKAMSDMEFSKMSLSL
jgi:outer membrane protein OmpA-like peptidoglycan-associated protein